MYGRIRTLAVTLLVAAAVVSAVPGTAAAADGTTGTDVGTMRDAGVGFSGPFLTGLSGKYYLEEAGAMQAQTGLLLVEPDGTVGLTFDYIVREFRISEFPGGAFDLHAGFGLAFGIYDDRFDNWVEIAPRAVVGMGLKLGSLPIEIAAEWTPNWAWAAGDANDEAGGLDLVRTAGYVRYYF